MCTGDTREVVYVRARIVKRGECGQLAVEIQQPGCTARVIVDKAEVFKLKAVTTETKLVSIE